MERLCIIMGPIDQILSDLEVKVTKGQRVKIESLS